MWAIISHWALAYRAVKKAITVTFVSGSYLPQFDKEYVHSHTDVIAFMSKLQHETEYEILDLVKNKWVKQRYTFLVDNNEQEETQKMIHNFRMGWCRLCN